MRVTTNWAGAERTASNLHAVWDDALVQFALNGDEASARSQIARLITPNMQAGTPRTWATEAHGVAVSITYGRMPTPPVCGAPQSGMIPLSGAYADAAAPAVRLQLARAATRLAVTLNAIWDAPGR